MSTIYTKIPSKTLYAFLAIAITLLSACGKSDNPTVSVGSMSIYNVSPTFNTYDVYLNGAKFNTAALPFGGGVKYLQMATGTYEAKFTTAGATEAVYTKTGIAVNENTFSSLYLVGTAPNFDAVLVADNFGTPAADKAYVRFINLSPDAPALDLGIKDGDNIVTDKAYKAYSAFTATDAGAKVFEIKETASGTVKSTVESTTLKAGYFYTIISRGKLNPNGSLEREFSGQVILHQ